ncbi:MAG: hypothetical protein Q8S73_34745 [Deltaproteobacteria bacterium]|nr:hypothetical protein [Myxococcales bacterium]MDP3219310.1 hypothetical protein [Deltaproteobacteria bacterium]
MKRRPSLRAPFVLTIAATAAMGCGASVSPAPGDGGVTSDTPSPDDRPAPVDRPEVSEPDVRRACPATLPAEGASCTPGVDPETCHDPSRPVPGCPPGTGLTMYCQPATQRWQALPQSCNPPPPVQCPIERPTEGAPCPTGFYLSPPLRCQYDLCGTSYSTLATCEGPTAQWSVQRASCNPPPPMLDAGFPPTDT